MLKTASLLNLELILVCLFCSCDWLKTDGQSEPWGSEPLQYAYSMFPSRDSSAASGGCSEQLALLQDETLPFWGRGM